MGGRSKGCISCKARRIKCDEIHPMCRRCSKAGIECAGYGPSLIFVDETPRIERAQAVTRLQQQEMCDMQRKFQPMYHSGHLQTAMTRIGADLPMSLSMVAFHDNLLLSFLFSKLLEGRSQFRQIDLGNKYGPALAIPYCTQGNWIATMVEVPHKSLTALAAMFFGQVHGLQDVMMYALRLYGSALSDMRATLLSNSSLLNFSTLASITSLCMFELATSRSCSGWLQHAACLERLMELRGPWQYKKSPEQSLFLEQRSIIVSKAVVSQERTILSQQMWKTVPWEMDSTLKQPFDFLIDIWADVASHLADSKQLFGSSSELMRKGLEFRVVASLTELNAWWHQWSKQNSRPCWEVTPDPKFTVIADTHGPLFQTTLEYDRLWTAYTLCMYNTARILLLQILQRLAHDRLKNLGRGMEHKDMISNIYDEQNDTPLLGISSDSNKLALEVIRSMDYCNEQSGGWMGTYVVITILDVSYSALKKDSREAKWLWKRGNRNNNVMWSRHDEVNKMLPSCQLSTRPNTSTSMNPTLGIIQSRSE